MIVITRDKVKELLGITTSDYDAQIDAKIPYIDAKVKQITRNKWDYKFVGSPELDSNKLYVYEYIPYPQSAAERNVSGINNSAIYSDVSEALEVGQLITGVGIPADTYIQNIVKQGTDSNTVDTTDYQQVYIELSANATASGVNIELTAGINIAYQDIIAKGIWYLIDSTSTTLPKSGLASRSYGPVSVSFSNSNQQLDGKSGMPSWFVKGLPRYTRGY